MNHLEGFLTGARGFRLYYQGWLPEGEAKAVILIVHGLAEHSGRYMNVVDRFLPLGYAVYGIDHLGHGKSEGQRLYVDRFEDFTRPLMSLGLEVGRRHPGKPVFLIGHSMGGLIGVMYLLARQGDFAGAVLSGPAVKPPATTPPEVIFIGRLLSALIPRIGLVPLETEGVSRDPAVLEAYLADPLVCRGKMTARLGAEMLSAMKCIRAEAGRITLPLLIVQGGADRLVDPAGARMLYDTVSSADKELLVYEGLYREVFNEPERDRVLADVEVWLEKHLPPRQ